MENNIHHYQQMIRQRYQLLKLPKDCCEAIIKDFTRWLNCNGQQWTVDRMKTIKQCIIKYRAEDCELPSDFFIKRRGMSKKIMHGPYGKLQLLANKDRKMFRKVLTFFNMYTLITDNSGLTPEKVSKYKSIIEKPMSDDVERYVSCRKEILFSKDHDIKQIFLENIPESWDEERVAEFKKRLKLPYYGKRKSYAFSKPQKPFFERNFSYDWYTTMSTKSFVDLASRYQKFFEPVLRNYPEMEIPLLEMSSIGSINLLEQGGLKDRYVLSFKKPLEYVLAPLGNLLYDMVACCPWDVTFQEDRCFEPIQARLSAGYKVHSVDLTAATDRFPWDYQKTFLKSLYSRNTTWQLYINLYEEIVKMSASFSGKTGETGKWVVGQPLGSYPSFAVFTLTHGAILWSLNGFKHDDAFFVHGDDVVILDDTLAEKYKEFLEASGVESSKFKTITSNKLAEINSKVIDKNGPLVIPKWKYFTSTNVIPMAKLWGLGVVDLAYANRSEEFRNLVKNILSLPLEDLNGEGINPNHIPLEERMRKLGALLFLDKHDALAYSGSTANLTKSRFGRLIPMFKVVDKKTNKTMLLEQAEYNKLLYRGKLRSSYKLLYQTHSWEIDNYFYQAMMVSWYEGTLLDKEDLDSLKRNSKLAELIGMFSYLSDSEVLDILGFNIYDIEPELKRPLSQPIKQRYFAQKRLSDRMSALTKSAKQFCDTDILVIS